ncbi:MAG: hypothetical protein HY453_01150 [Parcubacteria group bacterium]|nr:hypothetical protein [Parcubacteria group bacterium]
MDEKYIEKKFLFFKKLSAENKTSLFEVLSSAGSLRSVLDDILPANPVVEIQIGQVKFELDREMTLIHLGDQVISGEIASEVIQAYEHFENCLLRHRALLFLQQIKDYAETQGYLMPKISDENLVYLNFTMPLIGSELSMRKAVQKLLD